MGCAGNAQRFTDWHDSCADLKNGETAMKHEEIIITHHLMLELVGKLGIYFHPDSNPDEIVELKARIKKSALPPSIMHLLNRLIDESTVEW
jgi:hypothetical protein